MTPDEQFVLSCHYAFHTKVVPCPSGAWAIIDRNFQLLEIVSEAELPAKLRLHFEAQQAIYREAKARELSRMDEAKAGKSKKVDVSFDDLFG